MEQSYQRTKHKMDKNGVQILTAKNYPSNRVKPCHVTKFLNIWT